MSNNEQTTEAEQTTDKISLTTTDSQTLQSTESSDTTIYIFGVETNEMTSATTDQLVNGTIGNIANSCQQVCPCQTMYDSDLLEQNIQELRQQLKWNKKNTYIFKMKLVSAKDNRPSSQAIGYVGGLILIALLLLLIIADLSNIKQMIITIKRNIIY